MDGPDVALAVFVALAAATGVTAVRYFSRVRAAGATPRRGQLVLGNVLFLAFFLSLATLGGEVWFRFVRDSTDSLGFLRATERWFQKHYVKNRDSFRDDVEYEIGPVPAGKRRVSFVGDSFTIGHGVADVRDRFANRVRAARPGWDVHVLAQNGLDTAAELDFLSKRIPTYKSGAYRYDVVVLVYCMNDIADVGPGIDEIAQSLKKRTVRGVLAENSDLFDFLRLLSIRDSDPEVRGFMPGLARLYEDDVTWDAQKKQLRALRAAVESRGGKLAVVTFPFVGLLGESYPFREGHRRLGEFWAAEGVPHLDLKAIFDAHAPGDLVVNRFDGHPNERAHAMAADAMLPFLDGVVSGAR
jgi:hypothetical protein